MNIDEYLNDVAVGSWDRLIVFECILKPETLWVPEREMTTGMPGNWELRSCGSPLEVSVMSECQYVDFLIFCHCSLGMSSKL
jgi:hypothetical protein